MLERDSRKAMNAISDVVYNRPPSIRLYDQIYMKAGDLACQADFVAKKFDKQRVIFIGDGDSVALAAVHLHSQNILSYGPESVLVLDFDERIVNSINRFAGKHGLSPKIHAQLYNVVDPLPDDLLHTRDGFYTNPPYSSKNEGESVKAFLTRGIQALRPEGLGMVVIADDPKLEWTQKVLSVAQLHAAGFGFVVAEMVPGEHLYHLDDNPTLRSCTCVFRRMSCDGPLHPENLSLSESQIQKFYGQESVMIQYIREAVTLNYGQAADTTYSIEKYTPTRKG